MLQCSLLVEKHGSNSNLKNRDGEAVGSFPLPRQISFQVSTPKSLRLCLSFTLTILLLPYVIEILVKEMLGQRICKSPLYYIKLIILVYFCRG